MPGGAPYSILAYEDGGIDGCGVVVSAAGGWHSPLLASGLVTKDVEMQSAKSGEQFTVSVQEEADYQVQGQNFLTADGFENNESTMVASTPMQIVSTANKGSNNAVTFPTHWARGYQGSAFANNNPYLNPTQNLLTHKFHTYLRNQMIAVARGCDRQMFKAIFGNNYVSKSSKTGGAMTQSTETYATHITHAPVTWTPDIPAATNQQNLGAQIMSQLSLAALTGDTNGYSLNNSYQKQFWLVPDYIFNALQVPISCVHPYSIRLNSQTSDGTYAYQGALYSTVNNITIVSLPLDFFYTVTGSTNKDIITLMVVPDSIFWYAPKQHGTIIDLLKGFRTTMPGFTELPLDTYTAGQFLLNHLAAGPNAALSYDEVVGLSSHYSDPLTGMLIESINKRYPSTFGAGYQGCYDPLCYGVFTKDLQPSPNQADSWQTSLQINRFAGSCRRLPQYIVPIHIDPTLIVEVPPVYENPYSATLAAFETMDHKEGGAFSKFAYYNPDLIKYDLDKNQVHRVPGFEGTTRELIELKMGKGWERKTPTFEVPNTFENTLRGYQKQTIGATMTKEEKLAKGAHQINKMATKLSEAGL